MLKTKFQNVLKSVMHVVSILSVIIIIIIIIYSHLISSIINVFCDGVMT